MISRRNIRVKVMQTLYTIEALGRTNKPGEEVKILDNHLEQSRQLFIYLVWFLTEVARYAEAGLRDGEAALALVDDYFALDRESFVRRRFPGEEAASVAAFDLGRIAFDDHAAYAEAARWFEQYVTERPSGALVREATGRRMEALERSGDHPGAREAAARYLRRFPSGPHADVARSIADR